MTAQRIEQVLPAGRVAVLHGGSSAEREVSLRSGGMVLAALRELGVDVIPFDPSVRPLADLVTEGVTVAFNVLHGRPGEDGTVQGALDLLGIPYTGSGVLASALAMDKWRTKLLWRAAGLPTPDFAVLDASTDFAAVVEQLGLPIMVKPANEGSSIGMSKVTAAADLEPAWRRASGHDRLVIGERFVKGIELTAAILDGEPLPLIRLETPRDFYDYEAKYSATDTRYVLPCGLAPDHEAAIQKAALAAFDLLGCRGWGRVDLMLDESGQPFFLEVNTAPGMTDHSLVPMAARHAGIEFGPLCMRILAAAVRER